MEWKSGKVGQWENEGKMMRKIVGKKMDKWESGLMEKRRRKSGKMESGK